MEERLPTQLQELVMDQTRHQKFIEYDALRVPPNARHFLWNLGLAGDATSLCTRCSSRSQLWSCARARRLRSESSCGIHGIMHHLWTDSSLTRFTTSFLTRQQFKCIAASGFQTKFSYPGGRMECWEFWNQLRCSNNLRHLAYLLWFPRNVYM